MNAITDDQRPAFVGNGGRILRLDEIERLVEWSFDNDGIRVVAKKDAGLGLERFEVALSPTELGATALQGDFGGRERCRDTPPSLPRHRRQVCVTYA